MLSFWIQGSIHSRFRLDRGGSHGAWCSAGCLRQIVHRMPVDARVVNLTAHHSHLAGLARVARNMSWLARAVAGDLLRMQLR